MDIFIFLTHLHYKSSLVTLTTIVDTFSFIESFLAIRIHMYVWGCIQIAYIRSILRSLQEKTLSLPKANVLFDPMRIFCKYPLIVQLKFGVWGCIKHPHHPFAVAINTSSSSSSVTLKQIQIDSYWFRFFKHEQKWYARSKPQSRISCN